MFARHCPAEEEQVKLISCTKEIIHEKIHIVFPAGGAI